MLTLGQSGYLRHHQATDVTQHYTDKHIQTHTVISYGQSEKAAHQETKGHKGIHE